MRTKRTGLTLIELMLAVTILGVITLVAYFSFDAAVQGWRAGTELSDSLNHADFAMEQLAMGLRSAFYPDTGSVAPAYGFQMADEGGETEPRDVLRWVKIGSALVGADAAYAGTPHCVEVSVRAADEQGSSDEVGLAVRSWRLDLQPEEFKPEEIKAVFLSTRILGLNCRMLDPQMDAAAEELEWLDTWEGDATNRLPRAIELTLLLPPPRPGGEPVAIRRIVEMPLSDLSWNVRSGSSTGTRSSGSGGGSSSGGGRNGGGSSGGVPNLIQPKVPK
jgi:prepilin-type N-terminal cleavage/methylation domain-containing protein